MAFSVIIDNNVISKLTTSDIISFFDADGDKNKGTSEMANFFITADKNKDGMLEVSEILE